MSEKLKNLGTTVRQDTLGVNQNDPEAWPMRPRRIVIRSPPPIPILIGLAPLNPRPTLPCPTLCKPHN